MIWLHVANIHGFMCSQNGGPGKSSASLSYRDANAFAGWRLYVPELVPHWCSTVPYMCKCNMGTIQVPDWYDNGTNHVPRSNTANKKYIKTCLGLAAVHRPAQVCKDGYHTCTT